MIFRTSGENTLSDKEVAQSLATHNEELIKDLYALVLSLYAQESTRTSSLDSKAASLFAPLGILSTAAFIGLSARSRTDRLGVFLTSDYGKVVLASFVLALVVTIVSIFMTTKITDAFRGPGEKDLIASVPEFDGFQPQHSVEENSEKSGHQYRRFITEHFWKLYRTAVLVNDKKASNLRRAQVSLFFASFLIIGSPLFFSLGWADKIMITENSRTSEDSNSRAASSASPQAPAAPPVQAQPDTSRPETLKVSSDGDPRKLSERPPPARNSGAGGIKKNSTDKTSNK